MGLKIVDLTPENIDDLYPETGEFHNIRRAWVREMLTKGFRRKVAFDESGQKVAWIEWMPVEEALDNLQGENVNIIHCLYDSTCHNGGDPTRALLDIIEQESKEQGRGVALAPWRMRNLLLESGYKIIDEQGPYFLVLKAFAPDQQVSFIEGRMPRVKLIEGKVVVDVYWSVFCSDCAHGLGVLEFIRQLVEAAVKEVGDVVVLRQHLIDRAAIASFGFDGTAFLINGGEVVMPSNLSRTEAREWFIEVVKKLAS